MIELREAVNDLTNQVNAINNTRRKLEAELQAVHVCSPFSFCYNVVGKKSTQKTQKQKLCTLCSSFDFWNYVIEINVNLEIGKLNVCKSWSEFHVCEITSQSSWKNLKESSLQVELDDVTSQLKSTDEMLKQASADAARLAEELRQEQEHSMHVDRMRRALEVQIKEMQVSLCCKWVHYCRWMLLRKLSFCWSYEIALFWWANL